MSGGHFQYDQYRIGQIADEILHVIENNNSVGYNFDPKVIEQFKKAVVALRIAEIYAQRIDWLLSGDDGEESFLRRLKEDLKKNKERLKEDLEISDN